MRDYAKISPRFWTGETGRFIRNSGRDVQIVAFYVMTCPSANMIGLYYLPLPTLMHEIGMTQQGALEALGRAYEGGFCAYSEPDEVIWVPEMARFQIGETLKATDNRVKGVMNELEHYRKTPFAYLFYEKYRVPFSLPATSPFEAPSKPLRSQEQEQEQEHDQEQITPPTPPTGEGRARPKKKPEPEGFEDFWTAYPRRVGKKLANDRWLRLVKNGAATDQLLAAAKNYAAGMDAQGREMTAILHPSTFLGKGRWEDWVNGIPEGEQISGSGIQKKSITSAERQRLRDLWTKGNDDGPL